MKLRRPDSQQKAKKETKTVRPSFPQLLMSRHDGLHYGANSLSLRSGERARERGAVGKLRSFTVNVFMAFPSPRPSPHSFVVGRGRRRHATCSARFVFYPADSSVPSVKLPKTVQNRSVKISVLHPGPS